MSGWILLLATVLPGLAGCTPAPPEPLRVGINIWPGYEPLYLARELGYYADTPLHLVEYASDTQALRALRNAAIDAAALTLDELLQLRAEGLDLRVVAVLDFSNGADVVLARAHVRKLADMRGRRVGVENTAVGAYVLTRVLQAAGLTQTDIRVVSLELGEHEQAFKSGKVDVVVTSEPWRSRLLTQGAHQLWDSSLIPGEIVDVLAVRRDRLKEHAETVTALLYGWFRALDYVKTQPQDAAKRMGQREGLDANQFLAALSRLQLPDLEQNRQLLAGKPPGLVATSRQLMMVMLQHQLLPKPVPVTNLVAARPILDLKP